MTILNLGAPQTFETPAGPVTITGLDTTGPSERCVKGYIRRKDDPRASDSLEYGLNGVVQAGRTELNLDLRDIKAASLMRLFSEKRRSS